MSDHDYLIEKIQEGQSARIIRNDVEDELIAKEEDIISELVRLYRGDALTNDKLRGSIGEIAAIRTFRWSLENRIQKGVAAAEAQLGEMEHGQEAK